jgi:hypothetical protein
MSLARTFPTQNSDSRPADRHINPKSLQETDLDAHCALSPQIRHLRVILALNGLQAHLIRLQGILARAIAFSLVPARGCLRSQIAHTTSNSSPKISSSSARADS